MTDSRNREFTEQGGAATMDPSPLRRWLTSHIVNRAIDPARIERRRRRHEARRRRAGLPHLLLYFHQVDDPYSCLAAQCLPALLQRYGLSLECHLVSGPGAVNNPEPALARELALDDARRVAPAYGLQFPAGPVVAEAAGAAAARAMLAGASAATFPGLAARAGLALFSGDADALAELTLPNPATDVAAAEARMAEGDALRRRLGHYAGGMFYYGGEWYWGVDRLYHLEHRLQALGLGDQTGGELCFPRPRMPAALQGAGLTLEFFASLRSPYTAAVFEQAGALCERAGVALELRPVLPMVMRGVSLSRTKGLYIFADAAREARAAGVPFGPFYDPIGEPVRRCYRLFHWAAGEGREWALMASFLRAAFAEGVHTSRDAGMRRVVEGAGLSWEVARQVSPASDWDRALEDNRQTLYRAGCWGVPSFVLRDSDGRQLLATWGQDRLWLVARTIEQWRRRTMA